MTTLTDKRPERSLGELIGDLTGDLKHLVQQEISLAKVEMTDKLGSVAKDVTLMMVGAGVLCAGFLTLVMGLVGLIAQVTEMTWWQAGLAMAALCLLVGGAVIASGLSALKSRNLKPEQSVRSLKEDAQWLKEQVTTS